MVCAWCVTSVVVKTCKVILECRQGRASDDTANNNVRHGPHVSLPPIFDQLLTSHMSETEPSFFRDMSHGCTNTRRALYALSHVCACVTACVRCVRACVRACVVHTLRVCAVERVAQREGGRHEGRECCPCARTEGGLAAASTAARELSTVVMPALAILIVCCSIALQ